LFCGSGQYHHSWALAIASQSIALISDQFLAALDNTIFANDSFKLFDDRLLRCCLSWIIIGSSQICDYKLLDSLPHLI